MTRRLSLRRRRAADPVPGAEPDAPAGEAAATPPPVGDASADPTAGGASPAWFASEPRDSPAPLPLPPDATAIHTPVAPLDPSAPAGLEPGATVAPDVPGFRIRGRLRRRLRYLRRVRELAFRDIGGLVFDLHRFGRDGSALVAGKLATLAEVDKELRHLEAALDDRRDVVVLREPGIATCPRCATVHGSEANFCPNCALPLGRVRATAPVPAFGPATGAAPATAVAGAAPQAVAPVSAAAAGPAPIAFGLGAPTSEHPAVAGPAAAEPGAGDARPAAADPRPADPQPAAADSQLTAAAEDPPRAAARQHAAEDSRPVAADEQPTTTQPAIEPGAEPGRSAPAP